MAYDGNGPLDLGQWQRRPFPFLIFEQDALKSDFHTLYAGEKEGAYQLSGKISGRKKKKWQRNNKHFPSVLFFHHSC